MLNYTIITMSNGYECIVSQGFKTLYRGTTRKTYEAAVRDAAIFLQCLGNELGDMLSHEPVRASVTCIRTRKTL
jgi:hypothetical protein